MKYATWCLMTLKIICIKKKKHTVTNVSQLSCPHLMMEKLETVQMLALDYFQASHNTEQILTTFLSKPSVVRRTPGVKSERWNTPGVQAAWGWEDRTDKAAVFFRSLCEDSRTTSGLRMCPGERQQLQLAASIKNMWDRQPNAWRHTRRCWMKAGGGWNTCFFLYRGAFQRFNWRRKTHGPWQRGDWEGTICCYSFQPCKLLPPAAPLGWTNVRKTCGLLYVFLIMYRIIISSRRWHSSFLHHGLGEDVTIPYILCSFLKYIYLF